LDSKQGINSKLLGIFSNVIEIYHGRDVACYVFTNTIIGGNKLDSKYGINLKLLGIFPLN
jgi:hypothetical protein